LGLRLRGWRGSFFVGRCYCAAERDVGVVVAHICKSTLSILYSAGERKDANLSTIAKGSLLQELNARERGAAFRPHCFVGVYQAR
jgi:hypothetical protein